MFRTSGFWLGALVFVFAFCPAGQALGGAGDSRELVSATLLEHAGLKMVWRDELPIKDAEWLEKLTIIGGHIYALSSQNYMISLDKEKGTKIFSKSVASVGLPVRDPMVYDDELIFILGNRLVEMEEGTGKEIRAKHIEYGLVCPAARNSSFFYLSGADRRLHVLRAKDRVQLFEVSAKNNSMITSILADEDSVIFATDAGNVISMAIDRPQRLWQFEAAGGIAGRVVRDGISLFFASADTNVYRVDVPSPQIRRLAWKYQVAGVPDGEPRVTETTVYQYVRGKGLTALDRGSGTFLWRLDEGVELLAETGAKAYVITKNRTLAVMDNAARRRLYSVNFREVTRFAANSADSKIYIADEAGRIACIQPVERE